MCQLVAPYPKPPFHPILVHKRPNTANAWPVGQEVDASTTGDARENERVRSEALVA